MSLDVHLRGERVGALRRDGDGYRLAYDPEAVARLDEDRARLSLSLPPRPEPCDPAATRAYVEGLLPQGPRRRRIAHELGLDPGDGYALIAELGRDCPGAVTFLAEGERAAPRGEKELAWLEEDELAEVLEFPPERCFDSDRPQRMRFALGGERHKLALVRDEDGDRWAWPEPGAPSTHILVPESDLHADFALNEFVCTGALRAMGMPVAHVQLETVAGRLCLVSRRFDRWGEGAGAERLHSESFEQAIGIAPDAELDAVHGLVRSVELLHSIDEMGFRESFFSVAFCRWALGDHDERHTANLALLHGEAGPLPGLFYDIASTEVHEPRGLKFPLLEVAERCSPIVGVGKCAIGLMMEPADAAHLGFRHLHDLEELLGGISGRAMDEGWHRPVIDRIHEHVARRLGYLREELGV
jgi:serine/threonine-protein kinase HipA